MCSLKSVQCKRIRCCSSFLCAKFHLKNILSVKMKHPTWLKGIQVGPKVVWLLCALIANPQLQLALEISAKSLPSHPRHVWTINAAFTSTVSSTNLYEAGGLIGHVCCRIIRNADKAFARCDNDDWTWEWTDNDDFLFLIRCWAFYLPLKAAPSDRDALKSNRLHLSIRIWRSFSI